MIILIVICAISAFIMIIAGSLTIITCEKDLSTFIAAFIVFIFGSLSLTLCFICKDLYEQNLKHKKILIEHKIAEYNDKKGKFQI